METIPIVPTEDEVFSLNDIEFGVKHPTDGKAKEIEGYQIEIFKIREPILIPHIHKIFNLEFNQGFPKPWKQSLIVHILKMAIETFPLIIGPL